MSKQYIPIEYEFPGDTIRTDEEELKQFIDAWDRYMIEEGYIADLQYHPADIEAYHNYLRSEYKVHNPTSSSASVNMTNTLVGRVCGYDILRADNSNSEPHRYYFRKQIKAPYSQLAHPQDIWKPAYYAMREFYFEKIHPRYLVTETNINFV